MGALIKAYRISPEWTALNPSTKVNRNIYLRPLEDAANLSIKGFGRKELLFIRDAIRADRGTGAATGFIRTASVLFSWAVDREWIAHSPLHRIKSLPGGHILAWTRQQADIAQARLPEPFRRAVVLARYTGQRRGDLTTMLWSAYDGYTIRLVQQKTGAALVLPVHPALKAELDAWRAGDVVATTILTNSLGRPWTAAHLTHSLPIHLARLGLPVGLNIHGLRKLAATELADAGCSVHEIAAVTGHKTLAMVELYTRSADQQRLADAAVVKLTEFRKRKQT